MTNAIHERWKEWNSQGFIPGPEETEIDFEKRVSYCRILEHHLQQQGSPLPFESGSAAAKEILEEAIPRTEELYGIAPRWVPLFFSNYQLTSWQGGCAWIFQLEENTPTAAFLQLRSRFRESRDYLKLYQRNELIAHELAHVGRMLFQEPHFEEILAYQSSASAWRRWLGPIFQSSKESLIFVLLLGISIMADFALLSMGSETTLAWGIKLAPLLLIVFALGRLFYRHYCFNNCLHRLKELYSHTIAHHFIYRLRDSEIKQFSRNTPSQIRDFIEKTSRASFRWNFLKTLYPPY